MPTIGDLYRYFNSLVPGRHLTDPGNALMSYGFGNAYPNPLEVLTRGAAQTAGGMLPHDPMYDSMRLPPDPTATRLLGSLMRPLEKFGDVVTQGSQYGPMGMAREGMGPGELPGKLKFVDFFKKMESEKSAGTGISMHPPEPAKPVLARIFAATHDDPDLAIKAISKIAPDQAHAKFWLAQHLFKKALTEQITPAEIVFLNTHMMGGK